MKKYTKDTLSEYTRKIPPATLFKFYVKISFTYFPFPALSLCRERIHLQSLEKSRCACVCLVKKYQMEIYFNMQKSKQREENAPYISLISVCNEFSLKARRTLDGYMIYIKSRSERKRRQLFI